jgi:signal transduction histidine kinase
VSLARSRGQGGARITAILAFVFPAMIAAALALAYFGYQGAQNVVAIARGQFERNAARDATELGQKVDSQLNVTVNAFMSLVQGDINDPLALGEKRCNVETPTPGLIEGYVIYFDKPGQRTPIDSLDCSGPQRLGPKQRKGEGGLERTIRSYQDLFEWKTIAHSLKYVHVNDNLFAVTRFKSAKQENRPEQSYFLVAKLDLLQIRRQVLSNLLLKLCDQYRVALINRADGRALRDSVLCGSEPVEGEGFYYEGSFEPNLYAWNLRLAATEEDKVNTETTLEWQKVINPLFVLVSTVIIAVGLGIVLLSVVSERRASRLKSDFIANVSHELKTPLSLIRMFGEMVATGRHKGEETAREYGSIITRESERLSHLIDNVLDFARLERGKASYDFVENDLALVLERALDVSRYRLDKERIKLRVRVDPDLPMVRMDENAITLVILNLVDNAIKYGAEGGAVEVTLDRVPGGVVLSVRDFGPGIPREEQTRIFDRFYRAQSARDRNVRGSGIGLSLVRHIAEAHGGRVVVESPVPAPSGTEGGSVFRVFLPAPVIEQAPGADSAAGPGGGGIMAASSSVAPPAASLKS